MFNFNLSSLNSYIGYFSNDYINILIIFIVLIGRNLIAKIILFFLKKIFQIDKNKYSQNLAISLIKPLKLVSVNISLMILFFTLIDKSFSTYIIKLNKTLFIIIIFWIFLILLNPLINSLISNKKIAPLSLLNWISNSLKYIIIVIAIIIILEIWGIKVAPIVAGMGLFGIAVALGAQDLFKNLISGILIILENKFKQGDFIEITEKLEGTVENIGFRSTTIRKFDTSLISVPNYIFAEKPFINFSKRNYRRINSKICLTYNTTTQQLKNISSQIRDYIYNSDEFVINDQYACTIRVDSFSESSIDLFMYCYTNTNDWSKYLEIKENLSFEIKKIVEENNSSFAFPTRTIYTEINN